MAVLDEQPTLKTRRLILRALRPADAPTMAALAGDLDIARMTTSIPHPFTLAHAEDFIGRMAQGDLEYDMVFGIEHQREGFIGVLGFHAKHGRVPEIGYWIGKPFWGRGHMSEAVAASIRWARAEWRKRVLVSGHFADNAASGRVLCKAGFLYTGEVVARFSLARGQEAATRMMVWLA